MSVPPEEQPSPTEDLVTHRGGCHCGAIRFSVRASPTLEVWYCNCSICTKKQNQHFVVPRAHFTLAPGADAHLTTYTFNTGAAKHTFCKVCGVQSFYTPRSNPDGVGVMPHCIDSETVEGVVRRDLDGVHWESCIKDSDIVSRSKE